MVIRVTAPDGGITTYTYDAAGNVISVTYPDGQESGASVKYTYDALGRVTSVTDTLGVVQYRYTYDADGNLTSVTDAMGYTTWYKYAVTGNVTTMKDSTGGEVQYVYDVYSRLLEQKVLNGVTDPVITAYTYNNMGSVAESEGYTYAYDLNGNLTWVNTPEGGEVCYFYDASDRLIRTEEVVQVDVLDMQENSAIVRPLEADFEEDGRGFLYLKNALQCEVVVDLEEAINSAEMVVLYEEELLELTECTTLTDGVTADTSVAGVVTLTLSQNLSKGENALCSLTFTAKATATGTAYVAVAPESTLDNNSGTFCFAECIGMLADVCLPDYNGDSILDLRDFTLLAKQHGSAVDKNTKKYDVVKDGSIDDADLDYLGAFLFEDITEAAPIDAAHVADRTLQAAYTITTSTETRVTTYEYNAADQLTKVTDCNGNSVCYEYDSCGRMVKMTDQAGSVSEIAYDTAGNPVKVVMPEGVTESYTYDTNGSVLTVVDALGATVAYGYDAYGRTTSVTDAVGVTTKYQYDIAGNIVKNLSTGEIYCYNAYDEVVSYTDAEGNVTKVQYDAQGNITSTTDALGNVTAYTYRKDGLLTEIKDASGAVTLYEYNSKGLVSKETDALGAITTYEYDNENRPVTVTTPDGTVTEYAYNTDGSVTRVTATKGSGEAEKLCYLYALDGTLAASISSSDILEYTYNNRGSVEAVTKNNSHQVKLAYDGNGNLTRLEELTEGVTESVTSYSYNARGYLTKVSNKEGLLASYTSRADGLLEQVIDGAGNVTKYQYDQKKQVIGLSITAADGSVLYSEKNTYNGNGSLLTQNINGAGYDTESLTYTYDALDRLLSETKNGVTTSYTYDVMGNRLTKTTDGGTTSYVYDLCNKLLSETTLEDETTYSYDGLGNLIAKINSTGTTTYAYNALNQLAEVTNQDGSWQRNTYDASGIRSMITENGITTEFMTFNGLVLSGYGKNGDLTEHYYYGSGLLAAKYADNAYIDVYYYLKNSHGDVIGLSDNNGTLTETYRYDAFGTLNSIQSLNENGVLAEAETALSRFLYAGEQLDSVTDLYYLRARQYDTVLGRFTQEDTYLGDGRNLYVYVSNNPLKYVDPSGHEKMSVWDKMNAPYIEMSETALELYDPVLEAERKAKQERIEEGLQTLEKGLLITATGAIVVYFLPVTIPTWLSLISLTLGVSTMGMGTSDVVEGTQDIYYGMTGNLENQTINPVEEIFFDGDEQAYDTAEMIVSLLNAGAGIASTFLAEATAVTVGNVVEYANAGSQGQGLLGAVQDTADYRNVANTLTEVQKNRLDRLYNTIEDHLTESDFSGTLRDLIGDPVPNGNGGYFNHAVEMKDSYNALKKIVKSLEGSLLNPNLSDVDKNILQDALNAAISFIDRIEKLFEPFGGIK